MSALTKIFIVLQLVCSLIVAVVLVAAVKNQNHYKDDMLAKQTALEAVQASLVKTKNDNEAQQVTIQLLEQGGTSKATELNARITALNTEKSKAEIARDEALAKISDASNQVTRLTSSNESLSQQIAALRAENSRMGPENVRLITENAQLVRANQEAVTSLRFAEKSIRNLQEEISRLQAAAPKSGAGNAADTGTVASLTIQTPAQINGTISAVKPMAGRTLIEIPLGSRDGVRKGTRFTVSRGGNFIADAVVETPTVDSSVAAVENMKKGETVKQGDMVTSGNPQ